MGIAAAAVIVAVSYSGLGLNLEYPTAPGGGALLAKAINNDLQPRSGYEVTTPQLRVAYRRALAALDPDRTIAAVDRPYLIDYDRYDIPNMDLPGFTAPDGRFPFLAGPQAKVARLRAAGYDTLLATEPATDIALNPFALMSIRALRLPSYSPTTRYYLDWEEDLGAIAEKAPGAVTRFGPLLLIDLRRGRARPRDRHTGIVSITARFALDAIVCAGLAIGLWIACAGVGLLVLPRARPSAPTDDPDQPAGWRGVGVAASVGLGALMFLGGLAVVARIPWWLVVGPFLVAGLALAGRDALRAFRPGGLTTGRGLVLGGAVVVAGVVVALVEAPVGMRFILNVCDDYRAYMPMANRLLDTYGMEAAWSTRRLQSLGGVDLLRSLSLAALGDRSVGMVDTVVASVFLAGLFVGNGVRSTWARVLSIALILGIPFLFAPRVNTTGVLLAVPLLVAVLAATAEIRRAGRSGDTRALVRWAIAGGLVTAALMSVRPNHGVLAGAILALGSLIGGSLWFRTGARAVLVAGATSLLAMAPWSLAMWRTAGSPLYPLFGGNLSQAATRYAPLDGFGDRFDRAWDLLQVGPYLWLTLAVIGIAMLARRVLPDSALVLIAAITTVLVSIAFAFSMPYAGWTTFIRYIAPMSQGLAVFLVCETIRGADAAPVVDAPVAPGSQRGRRGARGRRGVLDVPDPLVDVSVRRFARRPRARRPVASRTEHHVTTPHLGLRPGDAHRRGERHHRRGRPSLPHRLFPLRRPEHGSPRGSSRPTARSSRSSRDRTPRSRSSAARATTRWS